MPELPASAGSPPVAELDRRFSALMIDQLLAALVLAAAVLAATRLDGWVGRVLLIGGVALGLLASFSLMLSATGRTPGKAALRLRVLTEDSGETLAPGPALLRTLILALAGLPTFGLGLATLASTAASDPSGRRRGWHDHVVGSVVYDDRPPAPAPPEPRAAARPMVNLTAARLVPSPEGTPPTVGRPAPAAGRTVVRPARPSVRWRLTADSGESVVIQGLALIGRAPAPRTGEQVRHLLPLESGDMSISKTHVSVDLVDGVPVVTDRGSTNGSVLVRRGVSRGLGKGRPATLLDGDRVRVGDRELIVSREV
jgi:uncharacterized RDD family membrane protein YckC